MLEHFFSEEKADELSDGPMGAYLPRLAVKLIDCDYGNKQGRRILLTAAAYGEWLRQHEVALENAGRSEAEEYAAVVGRKASGRIRENSRGLTRVIEYLRPFGILNRPEPPTIADEWITRFDEYCRRVRGLAVSTRSRYFRFIRLFITRIAGDCQPNWSTLTGHDVAQFAKAELAKVRVLPDFGRADRKGAAPGDSPNPLLAIRQSARATHAGAAFQGIGSRTVS